MTGNPICKGLRVKTDKTDIYLSDNDWIKRGSWDLNVDSLQQFFVVIGAGRAGNPEVVAKFLQKPVALNMPDLLVEQVVEYMDSNKKGDLVPDQIRAKFDKITNIQGQRSAKGPQKRRVVLKDERKTKR